MAASSNKKSTTTTTTMASSPTANNNETPKLSMSEKLAHFLRQQSLWDFVDPSQPWVLYDQGSFLGIFDFIPAHYRFGPWSLSASLFLACLLYSLLLAAALLNIEAPETGWLEQFAISEDESYQAFTLEWYYTLAAFLWMLYICWNVYAKSPLSTAAWMSFTLWSWTIVTIRHGLCVVAPFLSSVRFLTEVLRFPALLSASITTGIWNLILFPAIVIVFLKDAQQRRTFIGYVTNFRLTQLHVFNLLFAVMNGAYVAPKRPLHLGDLAAGAILLVVYIWWYYGVLDRLGIHLYPIFSPRTPLVILSWSLIVAACIGGYHFWKGVLEEVQEQEE
jgi:hypothetical protein